MARQAAKGRRAHHRCNVLGCPCRMDFSRAACLETIHGDGEIDFGDAFAGFGDHVLVTGFFCDHLSMRGIQTGMYQILLLIISSERL